MSNLSPFENEGISEVAAQSGHAEDVFRAPLEGFDWAAYESRQTIIDKLSDNPRELAQLLSKMSDEYSEGAMLNNLHSRVIGVLNDSYRHLELPLTVMTGSTIAVNMPNLNFEAGIGVEADFSQRQLDGANFNNSVVTGANFSQCDLRGASMVNAVLNGVNFDGAQLDGVDARGAYLVNVHGLTGSQITGMDLMGARVVYLAKSDEGDAMRRVLASRFGNYIELSDVVELTDLVPVAINQTPPKLTVMRNLKGLVAQQFNARGVDFTGSNMTGATIDDFVAEGAVFRATAMSGAQLRSGTLKDSDMFGIWAPGVLIEDVNMRGANLAGSNLAGSLLREVDLRGAIGLEIAKTNTQGIVLESVKLPISIGYDGNSLQPSDRLRRQLEQ
jgi:uncharacterized protein YjbI with pentapeptide repeats